MVVNEFGRIAEEHFIRLPERFPEIIMDVFQIMPNHVHAVIAINPVGATLAVAPLSTFIPLSGPDGHHGCSGAPIDEIHNPVFRNENTIVANSREMVVDHEFLKQNGVVLHGGGASASNRAGASPAPTGDVPGMRKTGSLGNIVGAYKSLVANDCLKIYRSRNQRMGKLWQRNYYDCIIRDDTSLRFIWNYIRENPLRWIEGAEKHIDRELRNFEMNETGND